MLQQQIELKTKVLALLDEMASVEKPSSPGAREWTLRGPCRRESGPLASPSRPPAPARVTQLIGK